MKLPLFIKTTLLLLLSFFCLSNGLCAAEKLVLQLPWHHQFQFAGYYMAKELGYYQDAGLDVEIRDVTQGANTVEAVVSGQADFGISGSGLLVERSQGKPVIAVATIFQQDPTVFLTLKQSNIRHPSDFIGKKVMLSPGFQSLPLIAMLNQEQLLDKVDRIATSFDPNSLLNGQADVFNAYRTNEPYHLESLGYSVTIINPEEYGIYFYGDTLFTSEAFLKNQPKALEKFRKASIKGWEYALSHPDEAIAVIQSQYQVTTSLKQLQFEAAAIEKIIQPGLVEIGTTDLARWAQITHHLIAIGAVPPSFHMESNFLYEPPHGVHWDRLWPWVAGALLAFVLLFVFVVILSRSNIRLRRVRSQLRKSEARLNEAQHLAKLGSWELDLNTKMLFWSNEVYSIFGLELQQHNPTYDWFIEKVHPEDRESVKTAYRHSVENQTPYDINHRILLKDGMIRTVNERCETHYDATGTAYRSVGTVQDITDRQNAEQERLDLEAQLRQKYKMDSVGVMAGGMAHNFNNNLSIILGNVELAKMKIPPNPEIDGYLSNAKIGVLRSRDLIQQILTYSRQGIKDKTSIQLPLVIDETLQLLRSTFPTTINLRQQISSDSHNLAINADSSQIQECLVNLCNNAMYAMDEKGELIIALDNVELLKKDIPTKDESLPGQYAKLSVQDTGSGMSAETIDQIFDLFFTTKPVDEGTGVGLSTVQGIVTQHGGLIKVNSRLGESTTFELYFPVIEQTQATETITVSEDMPGGTEHLLLVDDDPMLASLGEQMLKTKGYTVSTMTDSTEALKLFAANAERFDLVITDQTMPNLCGKDLIQDVKKIRADIPTIICTGFSSKVDEVTAKELGANAFLMKPLDMPQLLQTVRRVLDGDKEN